MPKPTHVFVTSNPGRTTPIPANEASAPSGLLLMCEEGKVYRLPFTHYLRKRIAGGDLAYVDRRGVHVDSLDEADASDTRDIDQHEDGSVLPLLEKRPAPESAPKLPIIATKEG